ncbi:hypothetical protein V1460_15605 [Streptomyces sp. SCSIO 30461]|uniref:hypothetical protein n=1 Tax=Streptomyces sp. SCSIO 30461 TaxID=3118085 RepID=UPI0030CC3133
MDPSSLADIESVVGGGRAVIMAEDSIVVDAVKATVKSGRTATFYLTRAQFSAVNAWYWTPQRMKHMGLEPVSDEEMTRIRSELGAAACGSAYSNRIKCPNGHTYGAFEFVKQGIEEHGLETTRAVFSLKDAAVIRANPHQQVVCMSCRRQLATPHYYVYWGYGCCVDLDDTSTAAFAAGHG